MTGNNEKNEKKERKCIGVLIGKPHKDYQRDLLNGIRRAAFENDMNVAIFSTVDEVSELELFSAINYERLAGTIYIPYSFDFAESDNCIRPALSKAVRERNYPAVTIDRTIDGIPGVLCDDSSTFGTVIEHLIEVHGCKDIACMTGTKGHMHAERRLEIFKSIMEKHGLPIHEGRTLYGDFWYNMGDEYVESLLKSERGLPEAIVCANNSMGYAVYSALRQRGIRVPNDVIVANYSDERDLYDFITGAVKKVDNVGYKAGCMLIDMINGKQLPAENEEIACESCLLPSVTCGCLEGVDYNFAKINDPLLPNATGYLASFNRISADLLDRRSFKELFYGIDWYSYYVKNMEGFYFCMRKDWDKLTLNSDSKKAKEDVGFKDFMQLYYYRQSRGDGTHKTVFENNETFPVGEMLPEIFRSEGLPSSFLFRALRSPDRCYGYFVIDYGSGLNIYDSEFEYWLKDVMKAMDAQQRLQEMKSLYITDLMTGICNRNGFNNLMPETMRYARNHNQQLFTAVFDLNGLKFINDTFGHVEGDNSIKVAADIICDCKLKNAETEKDFRIGGDEFVKAATGSFTEDDIIALKSDIEKHVNEYNAKSGKAYPIYISTGVCIKSPDDDFSLDSVILEADKEMFKDKARIREATGFNPKRRL